MTDFDDGDDNFRQANVLLSNDTPPVWHGVHEYLTVPLSSEADRHCPYSCTLSQGTGTSLDDKVDEIEIDTEHDNTVTIKAMLKDVLDMKIQHTVYQNPGLQA